MSPIHPDLLATKSVLPAVRLRTDEETVTTMLVIDALALLKQVSFMLAQPVVTPRLVVDTRAEIESWQERADRWAKNKPEFQVPNSSSHE